MVNKKKLIGSQVPLKFPWMDCKTEGVRLHLGGIVKTVHYMVPESFGEHFVLIQDMHWPPSGWPATF